ncbi:MAG: peptide-methionine (S)-S-oxide reductase MsrA [Gammaproteobacteria bacterium]|nr:MAG: peptide-methionine (S)-S-oxide reductase MsrA [Gammaproteobacteria bacterium]
MGLSQMIREEQALPGRRETMPVPAHHAVLGKSMLPPFPEACVDLWVGMGCFWGAERKFWQLPGVWVTAVGYAGGFTPNPLYEEVCSGLTGHAEVVRVVFDPAQVSWQQVLKVFWESHDPTQGMRQGNDRGTQYRSAMYVAAEDLHVVQESRQRYQQALDAAGKGVITTEIALQKTFYYAEPYHQQYLHKNPNGYCGLGGTGVLLAFP